MKDQFFQFFYVWIIDICSNHLIKTCCNCGIFVHRLNGRIICYFLHLCHNSGIMRWRDLCAILPVYFVSIVFRRIMACRDVDARCTPKLAHRIGKLRRRS